MNGKVLDQARDLIRDNPSLIWYTKNYDELHDKSIVEAILNYGSWEETKKLFEIMGIDRVAEIFRGLVGGERSNLHYLARNFYKLYFDRHAY